MPAEDRISSPDRARETDGACASTSTGGGSTYRADTGQGVSSSAACESPRNGEGGVMSDEGAAAREAWALSVTIRPGHYLCFGCGSQHQYGDSCAAMRGESASVPIADLPARIMEAEVAYKLAHPADQAPAGWDHPSADDCDESEPDERDQEIARLRDAMTRWAERCAVMASEHAAYRRDTETLRKAAQAAVSRLEAEITDCRAALAAATPKPPEPPPNPLYRALAVRGDGVVR